jgi:hypothetical protein
MERGKKKVITGRHTAKALKAAESIVEAIGTFYKRTQAEEYTDVGDAWEVMLAAKADAGAIVRALRKR